ncbi:hypothetical protein EYR40_004648 [Pleurotus pulmonarius]|nr:hypothetical protein EYR38_001891 [Pleurotus pulmonarius]KAF4605857.1 hypothetical protein EYR40_004648 [Pleurotus pulmonarius]
MTDFAFQPLDEWEIEVINAWGGIPAHMVEEIVTRARSFRGSDQVAASNVHNINDTTSNNTPIIINIGQPSGSFTLEVKLTGPASLPQDQSTAGATHDDIVSGHDGGDALDCTSTGSVTESDSEFGDFVGELAPRYPKRPRSTSNTSSQGSPTKLTRID